MKYVIEYYIFDKDLITLVRGTHLQTYGTDPNYWHPVPVRNSHKPLTSCDSLVGIERLTVQC